MKRVNVGGLMTAAVTLEEMAEIMVNDCKNKSIDQYPKLVFSSNGQGVSLAAQDDNFKKVMHKADIIHADGMSIVRASRLLTNVPLPERCATTDFFHNAARHAINNNLSFYILGGQEGQNKRVVIEIKKIYPDLKIAGRRNGYFNDDDDEKVCDDIVKSGADILWVGLGKPKQEIWSVKNKHRLKGVGWIKTCGGLYGYLAGDEVRAPKFMQKLGAEWLWRAIQSPRRLGWRYLVTNPHAVWAMLVNSSSKAQKVR